MGLNQSQIADVLGVSHQTVGRDLVHLDNDEAPTSTEPSGNGPNGQLNNDGLSPEAERRVNLYADKVRTGLRTFVPA
jgi:hypothetical protein